jgi:predicted ATPase
MRFPSFYLTYGFCRAVSTDLAALTLNRQGNRFPILSQLTSIPRIVITGAPGSGKTQFIQRLRLDRAFDQFLFFDELARQLLQEDPTFRQRWSEFHREIYRRQCTRESEAEHRPFITDRGTVDAFAFHPETAAAVGTSIDREYKRYTSVIQLGSAARLGDPYYGRDDIRTESIEDALVIERAIESVWRNHPGYLWIDARLDFEEKYCHFADVMRERSLLISQGRV